MIVLGTMSGTSLDGLDLIAVKFSFKKKIDYTILKTHYIPYDQKIKKQLSETLTLNFKDLWSLHLQYGSYLGKKIASFIKKNHLNIDLIVSPGQTIFHDPPSTFQLGHGAFIVEETKITTLTDLRSSDLAAQGQGAPIIPLVDELLFSSYDFRLNLGGICNISTKDLGCDLTSCNGLLNTLSQKLNYSYDPEGSLARQGKLLQTDLKKMNNLSFFKKKPPKSLDASFKNQLLKQLKGSTLDQLRTCIEHIADQIAFFTKKYPKKKTLFITGGGAFNKFLIERITLKTQLKIILPSAEIINYKEALGMALLGALRVRNISNSLKKFTGAQRDCKNGSLYIY